jgi:hypothetical protein
MLFPYLDFLTLGGYNALHIACQNDSIGIALELMKSKIFQRKLEQVDRGKMEDIFPSSEKRSVFMLHLYWPQIRQILGLTHRDGAFWLPQEVVGHLIYLFCATRVNSYDVQQTRDKGKKGKKTEDCEKDRGDKGETRRRGEKERDRGREKGKDKKKGKHTKHKDRDKEKDREKISYLTSSSPETLPRKQRSEKKKLRNIFPLQKKTRKGDETNKQG